MFYLKPAFVFCCICCAAAPACFAQEAAAPSNQPSNPAVSGEDARVAAVVKELEAMKERIAQLEAELKSVKTVPPAADTRPAADAAPPQPESQPVEAAPLSTRPQTAPPDAKNTEPFAFADFTWLTGNARTTESPLDTKAFTPEIRVDVNYTYDFAHPADDTIGGSSEIFRSGEV